MGVAPEGRTGAQVRDELVQGWEEHTVGRHLGKTGEQQGRAAGSRLPAHRGFSRERPRPASRHVGCGYLWGGVSCPRSAPHTWGQAVSEIWRDPWARLSPTLRSEGAQCLVGVLLGQGQEGEGMGWRSCPGAGELAWLWVMEFHAPHALVTVCPRHSSDPHKHTVDNESPHFTQVLLLPLVPFTCPGPPGPW